MKRRVIGIVASITLASVGTLALISYVQSARDEALADELRVEVYVLSKDVPADTPVSEIAESLEVIEVPKDVQVEGAVRDVEDLDEDLVAAVDLRAGEQLLTSRLVDRAEATKTDVPAGLQEVTVALDPERAVGGELEVGDSVGVVLSFDPFDTNVVRFDPANPFPVPVPDAEPAEAIAEPAEGQPADEPAGASTEHPKTPNMTHLTFHKVLVTGVQFDESDTEVETSDVAAAEDDGESENENVAERAPSNRLLVTLALSSPEVEQVVFAAEFGHIWLTAENADADESGTRIVDLGEVYAATEVTR